VSSDLTIYRQLINNSIQRKDICINHYLANDAVWIEFCKGTDKVIVYAYDSHVYKSIFDDWYPIKRAAIDVENNGGDAIDITNEEFNSILSRMEDAFGKTIAELSLGRIDYIEEIKEEAK
jgi:hypothetical protein